MSKDQILSVEKKTKGWNSQCSKIPFLSFFIFLLDTESHGIQVNTREPAVAINAQDEEFIKAEPYNSNRNLSWQSGISQTSVHPLIRRRLLHPLLSSKFQELLAEDLNQWISVCLFYIKTFIYKRKVSSL